MGMMTFRFNPIPDYPDGRFKLNLETLARQGWMEFREFRGFPMVIVNHLEFPKQPGPNSPNLNLEVNGIWLYELNHLVVDVTGVEPQSHPAGNSPQPWQVQVHLVDGWPRKPDQRSTRPLFLEVSRRSLYVRQFERDPLPGDIRAAVEGAISLLEEVDLTPERELLAHRKAERDQILRAHPISDRASYEQACANLGCLPLSDRKANRFYATYYPGSGGYDALDAPGMAQVEFHRKYGALVRAIRESKRDRRREFSRSVPDESNPIWEDCENCGAQPSFLPHRVCHDCWPPGI